jgi:hypothetical protein
MAVFRGFGKGSGIIKICWGIVGRFFLQSPSFYMEAKKYYKNYGVKYFFWNSII